MHSPDLSSEHRPSAWLPDEKPAARPALAQNLSVDVCIVGAGIAGLTAAYLLAKSGRRTAIIDSGSIAGGQTHRTSAHLSWVIDDRFAEIERIHGKEGVRLAAQSHRAAIERIAQIVQEEDIRCAFQRVPGYLFQGEASSPGILKSEFDCTVGAGLQVEAISAMQLARGIHVPALRFEGQAQFHPMAYIQGLAAAYENLGGKIYENTKAVQFTGGEPGSVGTEHGNRIDAASIVVATNSPVNDRTVLHTKLAPYTTYVVTFAVPADAIPLGLYWDTDDPYHYVRVYQEEDSDTALLIVGGEDHKTGQATDKSKRFENLVDWTRRTFKLSAEPRDMWSGQVMETLDGLGFIGRNPLDHENIFVITGDSGMGLTHGTLGAMLIHDLVCGIPNPWEALYAPNRKPLSTLKEFVKENLNVALQMGDWLQSGNTESADAISPGTGAVIGTGLNKKAVFRDEDGTLHHCSAACPHLGCAVRWNSVEHIWDCPCHGSRFDPYGKVISGPAISDLQSLKQ